MGRLAVTAGRRSRSSVPLPRREAVTRALTAAGVPTGGSPLPTYDVGMGDPGELRFYQEAFAAGLNEVSRASWPSEGILEDHGEVLYRWDGGGVFRIGDLVAVAQIAHGWFSVRVAAPSRETAAAAISTFAASYPPLYRKQEDNGEVPITFWTYGQYGPRSRLRLIEGTTWAGIEGNYTSEVRAQLARLVDGNFQPGKDGQLILWLGPPGTGKTWGLRALAAEWADWAEFSYITDPDRFFGDHPDYMIDVLLHDSYEELVTTVDGDSVVTSQDPGGKWRVLILEDTGELLAADAKQQSGQGLSRLLNVVDGMVGQGLRVLVVVTTNDQIEELHPAVRRPGRCASQIEFGALTAEEASVWLGEQVEEGGTLAELYARRGDGKTDTAEQIARIAEKHADEATGYGTTAWNPETRTVLYVGGDWTDPEPIEADMLAIDGVDNFESEAEAYPSGWCDSEVSYVYPEGYDNSYACEEAALAEAVAFAAEPLMPEDGVQAAAEELPPVVAAAVSSGAQEALEALTASSEVSPVNREALAAVLETIRATHQQSMEAVGAALVAAVQSGEGGRGDALALFAIQALTEFARRPADPAPDIHVHTPKHDLTVNVEPAAVENHTHVQVPEQAAPVVHVDVEGARVEVPPAQVEIVLPEQPAPVVHVAAPAPAPVVVNVEAPRPRAIRVEEDPVTGEKIYVPEEVE